MHDMQGMEHSIHMHTEPKNVITHNTNLQTQPFPPVPGKETKFLFVVTEQRIGEPLREFEMEHEVPMHVVIVASDLSHFDHLHPELNQVTGLFSLSYLFREAGSYKIWSDATPNGASQCLTAFQIYVEGQPQHKRIELKQDKEPFIKKFQEDEYEIHLTFSAPLVSKHDLIMTFTVKDENSKEITDLQRFLGAKGHCMAISGDTREFLHVHPTEEVPRGWTGGPEVKFHTQFTKPGLYKIWPQFQHNGKIITGNFVVSVSP